MLDAGWYVRTHRGPPEFREAYSTFGQNATPEERARFEILENGDTDCFGWLEDREGLLEHFRSLSEYERRQALKRLLRGMVE
ncbi:MAG TPA: hypothetical protein VFL30_10975, partial [Rhodanobacteraceae bacterium]|nr:hypothetical protein [Rhodanobacteraceae bacterium]